MIFSSAAPRLWSSEMICVVDLLRLRLLLVDRAGAERRDGSRERERRQAEAASVLQRLLLYDPVWLTDTGLQPGSGRHEGGTVPGRVGGRQREPSQSPCKMAHGEVACYASLPLIRRAALLPLLLAATSLALGSADGGAARSRTFTFVAGGDIALVGNGADGSTLRGHPSASCTATSSSGTSRGRSRPAARRSARPTACDGCFTFRAAPSSATALRAAGFTLMNIANNHAHGLRRGGAARDDRARCARAHLDLRRAAGPDRGRRRGRREGRGDRLRARTRGRRACSTSRRPRRSSAPRRSEADVVIVYMHAGAEGVVRRPRPERARDVPRRAARRPARLRARDDRRRRRPRVRLRPAHPARPRVVPRPSDRLQPREPRRQRTRSARPGSLR